MLIYPNSYFKSVDKITIDFLKKNKIKALILDVDNTLIDYYKNISIQVKQWVRNLKEEGIKLYILSNTNHKEKVEKVANTLEIPYEMFADCSNLTEFMIPFGITNIGYDAFAGCTAMQSVDLQISVKCLQYW